MRSPLPAGRERHGSRGGARSVALLPLAALMTAGLLAGAQEAPSQRGDLGAAAHAIVNPQPQPDQPGGIVSTYVCIRALPGVIAAHLADGSWTFRRAQPAGDNGGDTTIAQDERDLQAVLAKHRVTSIARFMNGQFKRADLAAKYGLDLSYIANVTAGADVVALNNDLAGRFPALIERIDLDTIGTLAGIPNDPSFSLQWDMHNTGQIVGGVPGVVDADIDAPEGWDIHTGSASTIIAVLDTGVQADHPDLNGKVISGVDVRGPLGPGSYGLDTSDINGHGTHCSGIAAARGNDGIGVAGTNWNAKILAVRVTDALGNWNSTDVSEGVLWAVDSGGADVLSMSLQSFSSAMPILESALAYAYDSGTLPIAAAGNFPSSGMGHVAWPARYNKCMAIAATTNTDVRWFDSINSGSCDGPEVDVAAPGKNIHNVARFSGYTTLTGTSMATPHVAGLAGLIMSRNPALTVPQVEAIIRNSAEDKGAAGFDNEYGYGRVNLNAALIAAAPACLGNIDGNGTVNVNDLLAVISTWGACPVPPATCPGDIAPTGPPQGNGMVDVNDLLMVITHWGACP